jgi:hypothetical protein
VITLVNGWNFIDLKLSSATVVGTPNLAAINWFRIYRNKTASITTKLDAIEIAEATDSSYNDLPESIYKPSNTFNIYPNPITTESMLTIQVKGQRESKVKIFDINGKMVYLNNLNTASTLNLYVKDFLKSGIYIVSLISKDAVVNKQLIVK